MSKNKMSLRKKYRNGSGANGMNPNHYIISPAEAMNDYNIMLAKADAEANSDPWLPIVATMGGLAQQGIGMLSSMKAKGGEGNFTTSGEGLNLVDTASQSSIGANGINNVQKDVEVEGGEMYETPQGQTGEFKGPSHEAGGIPLEVNKDVPEGTKVYSDRLKVGDKTLAERKATRERQVANLEKIASNPLVDQAVKNATKRKMQAIEKEEAADLDFQEKVNNVQAMADTMVKAFGTGAKGVQKLGNGGIIDPITKKAFDAWFSASATDGTLTKKYPNYKESDFSIDNPALRKDFQSFLFKDKAGTKDTDNNYSVDGDFGKTTNAFAKEYADINTQYANQELPGYVQMYPGWKLDNEELKAGTFKAPSVAGQGTEIALSSEENPTFDWKALPEIPELVMSGKQGVENGGVSTAKTNLTDTAGDTDKPGVLSTIMGNMPSTGDMTKLIGNYLGMKSGIDTANEQRSTDVTHRNVFEHAGEESQKMLDNAKKGIEISKAQSIIKNSDLSRGAKKGARGTSRGVNQMRATDFLYDTALQSQIADISAKAAEQISGIDVQKSGVAMNADQLKGQGQYQADMANEAAKDAYYTALGLGRKDFATGLQQSGKDLNDMKENKIIENLMKNYGKWVGADKSGNLVNAKSSAKTTDKVEIPDGKGGKISMTQKEFKALLTKVNKRT